MYPPGRPTGIGTRRDGVKPGDIVGAIANEAGIESRYIGHIRLHDDHSTVDLPEGMPPEMLQHLQTVRVRNQPMYLKLAGPDAGVPGQEKPRGAKAGKAGKAGGKKKRKPNSAQPPR